MLNLSITEIKAFVPAKDFELSKRFYKDLGFTMASDGGGVAYFHFGHVSFLLQDFCAESLAENFMMHILVEDVDAWWKHVQESNLASKLGPSNRNPGACATFACSTRRAFYGGLAKTRTDTLQAAASSAAPAHEPCRNRHEWLFKGKPPGPSSGGGRCSTSSPASA
jgi:hypothetical protein